MKNFSLPPKTERVYLKRSPSSQRNIANIQEIEELLKSFDFNFCRMEEYPAKKQIEIVSKASLLVGSTGADLPISMFATNDCLLIELASGRLDAVGSGICAYVVGMRFQRIIGLAVDTDPIRLEKRAPPSEQDRHCDFYIDPDVLRKALSDSIALMDEKQSALNGNTEFWDSISNWGTEFGFRTQFSQQSQMGTVHLKVNEGKKEE